MREQGRRKPFERGPGGSEQQGRLSKSLLFIAVGSLFLAGCGGSNSGSGGGNNSTPAATPTIANAPAQNGAVVVNLADATPGATIYFTTDGSTPTTSSQIYQAPFLVASNLTVKALATASGDMNSSVASQAFAPNIPSGALVWSDEFTNAGASAAQPNANTWTYDTGYQCCGNHEQETYCAWNSSASPCDASNPNAFLGTETDGYLHIVARTPSSGTYTSGRLKSQGRLSFMYGRIEARMKLPESQGMWPAFWLLGNNIVTVNWPACGELDVMEHIDGAAPPGGPVAGDDWIAGSVHGGPTSNAEINGSQRYHAAGFSAADWHVYGMTWSRGEIDFYVDAPANVYAVYKSTDAQWNGQWPFDLGPQFIILNLAVGGDWPGNDDGTTVFPSGMLVDYVRVYAN
jgi:beta-glucanase (GH16 family)